MSYFVDCILLLLQELLAIIGSSWKQKAPCLFSGLVMNHVSQLSQDMVDRTLGAMKLTTCLLEIVSFLHSQRQRVVLWERVLLHCPLLCGIPQGAILSPLLLNLYMCPSASWSRTLCWVVTNMLMTC